MSQLEKTLAFQISALKLPEPVREYRFAAHHVGMGKGIRSRLKEAGLSDWRMDFAWPDLKFACEVEGGAWIGGRHTRGAGFSEDIRKYHKAMELGWNVYRTNGDLVKSGDAVALIGAMIHGQA